MSKIVTGNNETKTVRLSRRVRAIKPSATKEMAIIAAKIGGCVSLGQGVPAFPTPSHIIEAVTRALQCDPSAGQYSLQTGMAPLRERIARFMLDEKGVSLDPEKEICVTVGGMEALLASVMTVVDEGDEVILPSPTYASYTEQVLLAGGEPVYVPLTSRWGLDLAAIARAVTGKTRALMLCSPGNPTGGVFDNDEIMSLCRLAAAHDFIIITDEAYDYMIYDATSPLNPLRFDEFRSHVISVSSLSKKYALTGWRVGWVAAASEWMEQIMKVHDATAICSPTPSQIGGLAALDGDQDCVAGMRQALTERRAICCERLDRLSEYFSYVPPKGAFYVMAKYLFSDQDSHDVALQLLQEARVVTIPGGAFGPGGAGHLRISFGGEPDVLNEAFDRIERWVKNR